MTIKLSKSYRERLADYYYFARRNTRGDFKMVNSKLAFFGSVMPKSLPRSQPNGVSAHEVLFVFESRGQRIECCEPRRLLRLLAGKAWRDWHIEEWSNLDCCYGAAEMKSNGMPKTIIESVNKARKAKWEKMTNDDQRAMQARGGKDR